jgi:hypothetical protein
VKVWVYVEGESDRLALHALWQSWRNALHLKGWGLQVVPLDTKQKFLCKIGPRAAEKLAGDGRDLVVGLPDLYPNAPYANTELKHDTPDELGRLQRVAVESSLKKVHGIHGEGLSSAMERFLPSALKHDMEMLLLAARQRLREVLKTSDRLGNWRTPVEDQNQNMPPKKVVQELFLTKSPNKEAYKETRHAPAVLERVEDIRELLFVDGLPNCPVFKEAMDWIGQRTGVAAYR